MSNSLLSTDNPDIDIDVPGIEDLDQEELLRYQAEYQAVKTANTVLKGKCTRLWKAVLPHLDAETNYFKEGITDPQRAACVEHMHSIRHSVIEVSRSFLKVIGYPVVPDTDVQSYDAWIGGWKERVDRIINPIISPSTPIPPPQSPSPTPSPQGVNVNLDSSRLRASSSLPPLKLKTFSGEYSEYHLYKAVFKSLMDTDGLSEMQQACYLLDTLVKDSEAEKLVKYINPVQPGALAEMWERLDEKYDKTPLGEAVYLQKLLDIAHWNPCNSDEELKRLHDYVHENLHCLWKATCKDTDGDAAKGHIWRLLPDRLKRKLTDLTLDKTTYSIDDVMKILKKQVIHNDRNLHLSGILNPQKTVNTKSQKRQGCYFGNTGLTSTNDNNTCCEPMEARFGCLAINQPHHCHSHSSSPVLSSNQCHSSMIPNPNSFHQNPQHSSLTSYSGNNSSNSHFNSCSCKQSSFEHPNHVYYTDRSYNQRPNHHGNRQPGQYRSTAPRPTHWSHPLPRYQSRSNSNPPHSQSLSVGPAERTPIVQPSPSIDNVCVFCDSKNHNSHNCTKYSCLDTYLDIVWDKHLCKNCLQTGHIVRDCSLPRNCNSCQNLSKHSKALCRSVQIGTMNAYSASMILHGSVSSAPVFMQTAMTTISNTYSGKSLRARILPDSGSNKSYISEDLAKMLDLKVLGEFRFQMSTFGHEIETVRCKLVELAIWHLDPETKDSKQVVVHMMTNPQMCGKIEGIPLDDDIRSTIDHKGLQLADPEIHNEGQFSVDILLGLDYYYDFVNPSFQKISQGLVLLSTKFGEVLAGPSSSEASSSNEQISSQLNSTIVNNVHLQNSGSKFRFTSGRENSDIKYASIVDTLGMTSPEDSSPTVDKFDQHRVDLRPKGRMNSVFLASLKCIKNLTLLFILSLVLISSTFVSEVEVNSHLQVYNNYKFESLSPQFLIPDLNFTDLCAIAVNFDKLNSLYVKGFQNDYVLIYRDGEHETISIEYSSFQLTFSFFQWFCNSISSALLLFILLYILYFHCW